MTVFVGSEHAEWRKGTPVKADLKAIAKGMGVEVPDKATNPQIVKAIEAKRG